MFRKLILGSPGTGKTTRLLTITEDKLQTMRPERIAFFSFTRKAVEEARARAAKKFGLPESKFKNFRTIHSLAYRELGLNNRKVMNDDHWRTFEKICGLKIKKRSGNDDEITEKGDRLMHVFNYSRNTRQEMRAVWESGMDDCDWFELKQFIDTYLAYKKEFQLLDFEDMLEVYVRQCKPIDVDIAIIDEAQDLNLLQWDVMNHALKNVKELYIAGDDDQAIYRWSGADVNYFLNLQVDVKEVLPISYRLPRTIFSLADGIVKKISRRYAKKWEPRDEEGVIDYANELRQINFKGEWLVLCRSNAQLNELSLWFKSNFFVFTFKGYSSIKDEHYEMIKGYVELQRGQQISPSLMVKIKKYYNKDLHWFHALDNIHYYDREYYRGLLRDGHKLNETPIIHLNTIHGSKGGEADNVLLLTDLPKRPFDEYMKNPDDEHRVFYVGATRAKKALHILTPQTELSYAL